MSEVQPQQEGAGSGGAVVLASGERVEYDWLVVALGAEVDARGVPGVKEHAVPFSSYEDALKVRGPGVWGGGACPVWAWCRLCGATGVVWAWCRGSLGLPELCIACGAPHAATFYMHHTMLHAARTPCLAHASSTFFCPLLTCAGRLLRGPSPPLPLCPADQGQAGRAGQQQQ